MQAHQSNKKSILFLKKNNLEVFCAWYCVLSRWWRVFLYLPRLLQQPIKIELELELKLSRQLWEMKHNERGRVTPLDSAL